MENHATQVTTREGSLGCTAQPDRTDPHILIVVSHNDGTSKMSRLTSQAASALGTSLLAAAKEIEKIELYNQKEDEAIRNDLARQGIK